MTDAPLGDLAGATGAIVCYVGCCAGCQSCWGYSIGCHQEPCRCDQPCTCAYELEDEEPAMWRQGCQRHDMTHDQRHEQTEPDYDDLNAGCGPFDGPVMNPCPICGEWGPCGYDAEGRVLIHLTPKDGDDA